MSDVKKLIMAVLKFLVQQLEDGNLSPDAKESVEVAVQCLETAYGVDRNDSMFGTAQRSLLSIFSEFSGKDQVQEQKTSEEDKSEAERLKTEGNNLMKADKYHEAINAYTSAISLDKNNAVYYCNRAAAYSKLSDFCSAVEDCKQAIRIDPNYSKAYGRMGLACASMDDDESAINCYRKACELEPSNESYRTNLQMAEDKMSRKYSNTSQSSSSHESPLNSPVDIGSLLGNPTLVSMATQLMQDPSMQNLMAGFMSNSISQNQQENSGMEALLRAGQQLATQMQQANPELVASLRQQLGTRENPNSDNKGDSSQQH